MMINTTYVADFETTTNNPHETEVWAWGLMSLDGSKVEIGTEIETFIGAIDKLSTNTTVYFHNLKFDGSFILNYMLRFPRFTVAHTESGFEAVENIKNGEFVYTISNMGQWYSVSYRNRKGCLVRFKDSLKLIPFSLEEAGKAFNTEHRKLQLDYAEHERPGIPLLEHEKEYLLNDLHVLRECLQFMFSNNHNKSTIGACCLEEFKKTQIDYNVLYPNLYEYGLFGGNAGDYVHKAYYGGWCYCDSDTKNKVLENGLTLDVNSLYPYVMHSMSGNRYPVGTPYEMSEQEFIKILQNDELYCFVHFRCRFKLKEGYLPFIQIKNNALYKPTTHLKTSDVLINGAYYPYYIDLDGKRKKSCVELTLTRIDYLRFREFYEISDFEYIDGVFFYTWKGMFDQYIDKYRQIKENSTGPIRTLAKLFSNNLYGQMAKTTDSSYKLAHLENGVLKFENFEENKKEPSFIAIGAAITSYARDYTIRHAQKNIAYFCYSDTDSVHVRCTEQELVGFEIDNKAYGKWKIEKKWKRALFVRQKTYIEIDDEECTITCAGMPSKLKTMFTDGLKTGKYVLTDFKSGLELYGKLQPKQVIGGVKLVETTFKIR